MAKKGIRIPTFDGGATTPKQNFTLPYQSGQALQNIVGDVSTYANKVADTTAVQEATQKGKDAQKKALEEGNETFLGNYNPMSLTGEAFKKGATLAYVASKSDELETELKKLRFQHPKNPEAYSQAANEYKSEFLGTINNELQTDFSLKFDQINNNNFAQVQGQQILQEKDQQITDIKKALDVELGKITGGISVDGLASGQIELSLAEIDKYLIGLGPQALDLNASEIETEYSKIRNGVQLTYLKWAYSNAETIEEKNKILSDLKANKSEVLKDLQSVVGQGVLPFNSELGARELALYVKEMDSYQDAIIKGNASAISKAKDAHASHITDLKSGLNLDRKWDYSTLENLDPSIDLAALKSAESQAFNIGLAVDMAKKSSIVSISEIEANIQRTIVNLDTGAVEYDEAGPTGATVFDYSNLSDTEKKLLIAVEEEKLKLVRAEYKKKSEALENGTTLEYIQSASGEVVDLSDEAGIDAAIELAQTYFPLTHQKIKFSSTFTQVNLNTILSAEEPNQALYLIAQMKARYGKYFGKVLQDATTPDGKTIADAGGNLSFLVLGHLSDYKDESAYANQKVLWAAVKDRKNNEAKAYELFTEPEIKKDIKTFNEDWSAQFNDLVAGDLIFSSAIKETTTNIYYSRRAIGDTHEQAKREAFGFIMQNYNQVNFNNGQSMLLPKFEDEETFEQAANDILMHPGDYNVIVGNGETLNDFIKDKGNYTFGYEDGQLVLRTTDGAFGVSPKVTLPSGANDLIYSDLMHTPDNKNNVQSVDVEPTWSYDVADNWFSKFKKKTPYTKEMIIDVMGLAETETTTTVDKKAEKLAEELTVYFTETIIKPSDPPVPDAIKGEIERNTYADKFVAQLTNGRSLDAQKLNAISLAIKTGNTEEWMLNYMSKFDYLDKLKDKEVRAYVLEEMKKIDYNNPLTSKNNEATIMTPLQTISHIIRHAPMGQSVYDKDITQMRGYSTYGNYGVDKNKNVNQSSWYDYKWD